MKKKLLPLLLALALVFSMACVSAFAADAAVEISAATVEAKTEAGTTVQVPISITKNPGLVVGRVDVSWDSTVLELTGVTYTDGLGQNNDSPEIASDGTYPVSFGDYTPGEDPGADWTTTGTLFTLNFTVLSNAAAGDYTISLSGKQDDFLNNAVEEQTVNFTAGSVTLYNEITAAALTITAPVKGETPAAVATTTDIGYTCGTITWSGTPTVFAADTAYTATVVLTPASGYVFHADATAAVNGSNASAAVGIDGNMTVTYTFPKTSAKVAQAITCADITATYGDEATALGATTSGDGTISYSIASGDDVIKIADGKVSFLKAGTATITVTAAETDDYLAAETTITVTVAKAEQTITCTDITAKYGDEATALGATAQTTLSYEVTEGTDVVSVDANGNVTFLKAGTAKITVTAVATEQYASTTKVVTVTVSAAAQTITCADMTATYGDEATALGATAQTTLSYEVTEGTDVVSVDNAGNVTFLKAGTAKITVTAAATEQYASATKEVTVTVSAAGYTYDVTANTQYIKVGSTLDKISVAPANGIGVNNEAVAGTLVWYTDAGHTTAATDAAFDTKGEVTLYWVFTATDVSYVSEAKTGSVTFTAVANGDVNGDGKVSTADAMILFRYLADWDGYDARIICMDAADIDGNGTPTIVDATTLARYLAGWSGYSL